MPIAQNFCHFDWRRKSDTARAPIGAEMLARKKLGTRAPAVSLPSPLSDERKIAFHSSSLGATASASEDRVIPVRMLHLSRSTISCDLRTASAGLPAVSSISGWI